jgi:predicted Holliday junction resolvase-like endonuclease
MGGGCEMSEQTLNLVITAVLVPVMAALVPLLVNAINLYAKQIRTKLKDDELRKYVTIAEDAVQTAVISTYQTYVEALKNGEGWNKDTEREAFEKAKTEALLIMGGAAREALSEFYDDFDVWLKNKIERYVNTSK